MTYIISKPIVWNSTGYRGPSGDKASSGFPKDHGYGHEEWNNSSHMNFMQGNSQYRVFNVQKNIGNSYSKNNGNVIIFMYASRGGKQVLVGVAAQVTCLFDDDNERGRICEELKISEFRKMAWGTKSVRIAYDENEDEFNEYWNDNITVIPNCYCPADKYIWFDEPVILDPIKISGKKRLATRFSVFSHLDSNRALIMLDSVPKSQRTEIWESIRALIVDGDEFDRVERDIHDTKLRSDISETTRQQLIEARLGQGAFRKNVEMAWGNECAVSGCAVRAVLRASHIKPWKNSSDEERLDSDNGLLLTADIDALFDRGLISFDDNGEMLISEDLNERDRTILRIPRPLRQELNSKQRLYLDNHRKNNKFS